MRIKEINFETYFQDAKSLADFGKLNEAHREETEKDFADQASVDFNAYSILQKTGDLIALGIFDEDALVGYACAFVAHSFHYDHRVATNDSLFVLPAYRKRGYGIHLMREVEKIAKRMDAKYMIWQAKIDSPLSKVLQRSCKAEEIVYLKEL